MSATSSSKPVNPVDAAWLRMDRATNAMVITTVFRFDGPLDPSALDETFERLLAHRKFRQKVVLNRRALTGASWVDDTDFRLDRHVARVHVPDELALDALVSRRMSEPLDRAHPLWHIDVIEGIGGEGAALVIRVHHAVGDGVTLVRLLLGVSRAGAETKPVDVGVKQPPPARTLAARARRARDGAATLARLLLLHEDARTPLRAPLGDQKRAATSKPIPVAAIKAVARARGGSVNDVLAAAVAGAVRAQLDEPVDVRALVPLFLRGEHVDDTGNHFGLAYLPLPIAEPSQAARIAAVKREMDAIKRAPDAAVAFVLLGAMGLASPTLERHGVDLFTKKATMLVTNVPGPAATVQIGGRDVRSMVVWAPTSGSIGLGWSLLTYAGELRLGVAADANLGADPRALVAHFEAEMDAMIASLPSLTSSARP